MSIEILLPGICVGRVLMSPFFATPGFRLLVVAAVTVLFYWPIIGVLMQSVSDEKQPNRRT